MEPGKEGLAVGVEDRAEEFVGVEERAEDFVGVEDRAAEFVRVEERAEDFVGVEERAEDLVGVDDLTGGATFLVEGTEARELSVKDLEGLVVEGNVGRAVGVADLRVAGFGPSDDEGLLFPLVEDFNSEFNVGFLDAIVFLEAGSTWIFDGCSPSHGNTLKFFKSFTKMTKLEKYYGVERAPRVLHIRNNKFHKNI